MSRLDRHVAMVQNKLALGQFLFVLARAGLTLAAVVWAVVVIAKCFGRDAMDIPHHWLLLIGGGVVAGGTALVLAIVKRPTSYAAATAIDETLGLKEKFSTALYVRPDNDPFAQAAVRDAERTAENVSLFQKFPLQFPRAAYTAAALAVAAFLTAEFMPKDLFGTPAAPTAIRIEDKKAQIEQTKKQIADMLAVVNRAPESMVNDETIKQAKQELESLLKTPINDPDKSRLNALKALQNVEDAYKKQIEENQKVADAQRDAKLFRSMTPPANDTGPVADAHRDIAKGDFEKAVDDLEKSVDNFDKMDKKDQDKAAEQMKNLANQLQQMANNPQAQQQMQQKFQQMGANQQQAQQMAQAIQQAAQGNQAAQNQLQKMTQNMQQQMNNGQGPNQQQQKQIQQMMQQMQAQANSQATAQSMAQAAQQMAQAMQQAQQAGGNQQQQGNPQQQAAANAQQGGNQQGGKQSGGQQGNPKQQMAAAQQQMQQQLQQMQAAAQDAQQIAAAQQAAKDAAGAGNKQGGNGNGNGKGGQANANVGQWKAGNPNQQGGGNGNAGISAGGPRPDAEQAPYSTKAEMAPTQDIETGKILAMTLVKANSVKGESHEQFKKAIESAEKDAPDEVDQERVSRQSAEVVKGYFGSMEKDLGGAK